MTVEKILGEGFRALEPRRLSRRTKAAPIGRDEAVDNAGDQRTLGPDDGEVDILGDGKLKQGLNIVRGDLDVADLRFGCRAGVAGRNIDMLNPRRCGAFPCQRVLATAAADNQHFHTGVSSGGNGASR